MEHFQPTGSQHTCIYNFVQAIFFVSIILTDQTTLSFQQGERGDSNRTEARLVHARPAIDTGDLPHGVVRPCTTAIIAQTIQLHNQLLRVGGKGNGDSKVKVVGLHLASVHRSYT